MLKGIQKGMGTVENCLEEYSKIKFSEVAKVYTSQN